MAIRFFLRRANSPAGASLLAKNLRAPRSSKMPASALTIFASKLAPTGMGAFARHDYQDRGTCMSNRCNAFSNPCASNRCLPGSASRCVTCW
ncbi:hypothetical protein FIV38_12430 [Pseudomonas proteolytica]|nr:hypothetical protein F4W61_03905 [Pseudomonas proteolytica]TWR83003.1 hypothetical protein FIV38_12430 [Pseudomonas proteolytica]